MFARPKIRFAVPRLHTEPIMRLYLKESHKCCFKVPHALIILTVACLHVLYMSLLTSKNANHYRDKTTTHA